MFRACITSPNKETLASLINQEAMTTATSPQLHGSISTSSSLNDIYQTRNTHMGIRAVVSRVDERERYLEIDAIMQDCNLASANVA